MLRWIGHQPQVRQRITRCKVPRSAGIKRKTWGKHIACRQPEDGPQLRQRAGNATGGLQCSAEVFAFVGI